MAPIQPGEHLAEELTELGISAAEFSRQIGVPTNRITRILNGHRSITGDTALRLTHFFGITAEFWLNRQSLYEMPLRNPPRATEVRQGNQVRPHAQNLRPQLATPRLPEIRPQRS
jgi:antitoxin HigA-1